jgi:hypothetical protein
MVLSDEDRAVLNHIVIDADVWAEHAVETIGESAVTAKIERWKPVYLAEKERLGEDYKTRAERETEVMI